MRAVAITCVLFCATGGVLAGEWPRETSRFLAGTGARCEIAILVGSTQGEPVWEGRTLARGQRVRIINRRARGDIEPGPEELLWTGEGAIQFMGGHPASYEPGMVLSLLETYLMVELLAPLWTPAGTARAPGRFDIEGPFGVGALVVSTSGQPESLLVKELSRPLFDGSRSVTAVFTPSEKDSPWRSVTLLSSTGRPFLSIDRSRFKRGELDPELFSVESESDLTLADLSRPLGQLLGSDSGEYTETAGAQGLWDEGGQGGSAGPVYLGYRPEPGEVDRFLRDGKLGRYGDEK
jgi:hypothetical protein